MINLISITLLFWLAVTQYKLILQGPASKKMNCKQLDKGDNGFIGSQYFYEKLSNYGQNTNLDKITFRLWFMVYSKMRLPGKQILFAFLDGYDIDSYINLMVYFNLESSNYSLYVLNEKVNPEVMSILVDQQKDFFIGYWNYLLISIDQTSGDAFLNLKLFSTYNYQLQQVLDALPSQKLNFRFGVHSRITNEQLFQKIEDYKACVYVANFEYINGWATMDKEIYVQDQIDLKYSLKPYQSEGLIIDSQFINVKLRQQTNIEYSGIIGLNIYKDTRILYDFQDKMDSFSIIFWMKPQQIVSNFKLISFTDEFIKLISLGFGVNQNYAFMVYQNDNQINIGDLSPNQWKHITIGILEISRNQYFKATNSVKMMKIYIDDQMVYLQQIYNFKWYKSLLIGPLLLESRGQEVIDIQDLRIFNGYGISESSGDCKLFAGLYCAFCKSQTHYCKEQDPLDDINIYECPAGYKLENGYCKPIPIALCLRQSGGNCVECDKNAILSQGICQIQTQLNRVSIYPCSGKDVVLCQTTDIVKSQILTSVQRARLCSSNLYNTKYECAGSQVLSCKYSYYSGLCFECKDSYYLTELKICVSTCFKNKADRFNYINKCVKDCPYKYIFNHPCPVDGGKEPDLVCSLTPDCQADEIDLGYTCLSGSQKEVGKSVGCRPLLASKYAPNQPLICHPSCKYCFGTTYRQCLGCYEGMYFTPYLGMCLQNCSEERDNLFIYHNSKIWKCELKCPSNLLTQGDICVQSCYDGYQAQDGICKSVSSVSEYFLESKIIEIEGVSTTLYSWKYCPQLCNSCQNNTICKTCINKYPFENDVCKISCFPRFALKTKSLSSCKDQCNPDELTFWNDDLFGYQIAECFQRKCGEIEADQIYQSFLHQNDNTRCVYPCDDGYYGNLQSLLCKPCLVSCATCIDQSYICTQCQPLLFLKGSTCLTTCGQSFKNYMNWHCETECSSGYTIADSTNNLYACVEQCGQLYATYLYVWRGQCYENISGVSAFCINYQCEDCHSQCKQCQGPNSNDCLACYQNSYLLSNECVQDCGSLKYDQINWRCVEECPLESKQSSGMSLILNHQITVCGLTCLFETFQFRDECYTQQPIETFCLQRTDYQYCELCSSLCTICSSSSSSNCQECIPTAFKYGTSCFMECPDEAPLKDVVNKQCVASCSSGFSEDGYCVDYCQTISYRYLQKNACYTVACPIGTFNEVGSKICQECYTGCATCFGSSQSECLSCVAGYFIDQETLCSDSCLIEPNVIEDLINRRCVQFCPIDSFLQQLTNGHYGCKETCPEYYYSNICVSSCPSQTYQDGLACISCASPCSVCFGRDVTQCNKCDIGYYLYETTCYLDCPDQIPYGNIQDQTCVALCSSFLYLPKKLCFDSCPSFLQRYEIANKKQCVDNCLSKSYLLDRDCYPCDSICKECYGPNNGNCLECESPYFLNGQTCELTCPSFYDLIDHQCKAACPVNLVIQNVNCQLQCDSGYFQYGQNCLKQCPKFTYLDNDTCQNCNLQCLTCFGPTFSECYSCIDGFYLNDHSCQQTCDNYYDQDDKACVDNCGSKFIIRDYKQCVLQCSLGQFVCEQECLTKIQDGFYLDNGKCFLCDPKCTKCTSSNSCSECSINFYLEQDSCVNYCSNQYLYMDPISRSCVTKCPLGLYHQESYNRRFCLFDCIVKLDDQCVQSCPTGFYNENSFCRQCPFECTECQSITFCSKCKAGLFLEDNWCYPICNLKKTDRKNLICVEACNPDLFEFENQCVENCPSDPIQFHYKSKCIQSCPASTFQQDQQCIDCHIQCSACFGPNNDECYSCTQGYYLDNNQICTQTCPYLYDSLNQKCVFQCKSDQYLEQNQCVQKCNHFLYDKQCVDICPSQTYQQNTECFNCSNNCLECNSFGCIKCKVGSYLNDGICDSLCLIMYNDIKHECVELCTNQEYQYLDHCYSQCPNDTYEYQQNCLLDCPIKTVQYNNFCFDCPERCDVCLSESECLKCSNLYYLFNGECVLHCPLSLPYEDTVNRICLSECPPNTYIMNHTCLATCNLITHQNMCLEQCPKGYYGNAICQHCKLECLACNELNYCTECDTNYFLEDNQCDQQCTSIKDLKTKKCVESCETFLFQNICYQNCPINTYQFESICAIQCPNGYYGSNNFICEQCPYQCLSCSNQIVCYSCKMGYYLFQNQCLESCPDQSYSNPIENKCSNECPSTTYTYQNQCLFQCPSDYLHDLDNYTCVLQCDHQQYQDKNGCLPCSIECNGCYTYGNNNCINCAALFNLNENGYCLGECPNGYYKNQQKCEKCLHKCLSCINSTQCVKCRGGNRNSIDCSCLKGYYDDELYEDCQKCPCDECISQDNCQICRNNLQIPKCNCDRKLNDEWCISCEVAKVKIYYSDDLNEIVVYFGYLVSVNLINPFQPSDCSLWFDNSNVFGQNSTCYLAWNRNSVHIQLSPYSTIKIGDSLEFKQSFYRDVDQGICAQEYIKQFIENKLLAPNRFIKPYILFDVPQYVSSCKQIEIRQILISGTAFKIQTVISWQLHPIENEDYYLSMDSFLATQKNEIIIPINTLQPNLRYLITAKYINIFQRVNYTTFSFNTIPTQTPYVYLTYQPLTANIYIFDCHITFSDIEGDQNVQIDITDSSVQDQIYISLKQPINSIRKIPLDETFLPKQVHLLFIAKTQSYIIQEVLILKSKPIEVSLLQKNRFIGQDDQINARAFDKNIQDEIMSTKGIQYQWLCTNLHDLQPCKSEENKILEFASRRIINIQTETQNSTLVFYVRASKDNRWTIKEQLIVQLDLNIEEEFVINSNQPTDYVNLNSEITILLKQSQTYAFIIQNHKVLKQIKITDASLKFRMAEITEDSKHPIYIYLVPGSDSFGFKINEIPNTFKFSIEPKVGQSLDYFNYTIDIINSDQIASVYYYVEYQTFQNDLNAKSLLNGIPLIFNSQNTSGQFQIPNGISDNPIWIVCQIESNQGAQIFQWTEVTVQRRTYEMDSLFQDLGNLVNFSNLQSIHTMISLINEEDKQVCLKQCSGVGTCVDQKCLCPPGYYFKDCSGNKTQFENFNHLIFKSIQALVVKDAVLYFQQYTDIISKTSIDKCLKVLMNYIINLNSRMEQINQYSINIQYQQTNQFSYSQIDTRQILSKLDMRNAILSTEFIWNIALSISNSSNYQIMHHLNDFFLHIIDLSFLALLPNEKFEISMSTLNLVIQRSVNIQNLSSHRFLQQDVSLDYYDIVQAVYISNFYSYDGYYPYPNQMYPLYDYMIRQQNRYQNIEISTPITYKFEIRNDTTNLVCISRNPKTYEWTKDNCYLSIINSSYFCICSKIEPVTICNDYQYLYQGSIPQYLKLPNFIFIFYFFQLSLLALVIYKSQYGEIQQLTKSNKFGIVIKLRKFQSIRMMFNNQQPSPIDQNRIYPENDFVKETEQNIHEKEKNKFSVNYFWVLKFYLNRITIFLLVQYLRVSFILVVFRMYNLQFLNGISNLQQARFSQFFTSHMIFKFTFCQQPQLQVEQTKSSGRQDIKFNFQKQFKYFEYMKSILTLNLVKMILFVFAISTFIIGLYLYFWISDQTELILSYTISNLIDFLFLDVIIFFTNKYLGETKKKLIKKKIQEFKQAMSSIK
ncbi:unnamed protein product (macronuclear) [Paramecium tetraurelia]|uniref:Insulin-like growth factor binding protein, N-terminal n=1 Tax=Paramecium tetraurelia TaxID=5888 RepID=A0BBP4_PARTE|nr:uncharacterized protein GSPATT00000396001 [Paramecium tetraurelia]CAK55961.1 unnamed protein product [Paramecium tetraurelia]|eukprot:XP_001423359.1 hypothetical protein (macronuclear) [Paramecium tetraurelia strain d4-2]